MYNMYQLSYVAAQKERYLVLVYFTTIFTTTGSQPHAGVIFCLLEVTERDIDIASPFYTIVCLVCLEFSDRGQSAQLR